MIIRQHDTIKGTGGTGHHRIVIDWFDREWSILINDNHIQRVTTIHLWDTNEWRKFDGRSLEESVVLDAIKQNKIINLKYKAQ